MFSSKGPGRYRARRRVAVTALLLAALAAIPSAQAFLALLPPGPSSKVSDRLGIVDEVVNSTPLSITNFSSNVSQVTMGQPVWFNVTTAGGVSPLNFTYDGLPLWCVSKNVSNLLCRPSQVGLHLVKVTVRDAVGESVSASASLKVISGFVAPPHIVSFSVNPPVVPTGHLAILWVNATSASSISYFFYGLPRGCASFNSSELQCLPKQAGTFRVTVQATDGFGIPAFRNTTLTVTGSNDSSSPTGGVSAGSGVLAALGVSLASGVAAVAVLVVSRRRKQRGGPT